MITTRRGIFAALGLASLVAAPAAWATTSPTTHKTKKKPATKHPQTAASHKHGTKHAPASPATADAMSGGQSST